MKNLLLILSRLTWIHYSVGIIVLLGAFLRLYNVSETAQFLGDQGRDALTVSRIFKEGDLVFIGPVTSVGNMYLGPLYYYFMLPFLWISYPSPLGPVYAVALVSILTIFLMWRWGRELVGTKAALIGAVLFSFSAVAVEYSRFSWNPNPVPFALLLMMFACFRAWQKNPWYWVLAFIGFGILIQLHYLTLVTAGGFGLVWLLALIERIKTRKSLNLFLGATAVGALVFMMLLTPLILFDIRHDWLNVKAFGELFTKEDVIVGDQGGLPKIIRVVMAVPERTILLFSSLTFGVTADFALGIALVLVAAVFLQVYALFQAKDFEKLRGLLTVVIFAITSLIGIALYENDLYAHYLLFFFPPLFLLMGTTTTEFLKRGIIGWIVAALFFLQFLQHNIPKYPLQKAGISIAEYQQVASEISPKINSGEIYNIVLLTETKDLYGQNYRYFLSTYENKEPINPDRVVEVDSLVVINEEMVENPLDLPIYQLQIFPNKTPVDSFTTSLGSEVYILRKTPAGEGE